MVNNIPKIIASQDAIDRLGSVSLTTVINQVNTFMNNVVTNDINVIGSPNIENQYTGNITVDNGDINANNGTISGNLITSGNVVSFGNNNTYKSNYISNLIITGTAVNSTTNVSTNTSITGNTYYYNIAQKKIVLTNSTVGTTSTLNATNINNLTPLKAGLYNITILSGTKTDFTNGLPYTDNSVYYITNDGVSLPFLYIKSIAIANSVTDANSGSIPIVANSYYYNIALKQIVLTGSVAVANNLTAASVGDANKLIQVPAGYYKITTFTGQADTGTDFKSNSLPYTNGCTYYITNDTTTSPNLVVKAIQITDTVADGATDASADIVPNSYYYNVALKKIVLTNSSVVAAEKNLNEACVGAGKTLVSLPIGLYYMTGNPLATTGGAIQWYNNNTNSFWMNASNANYPIGIPFNNSVMVLNSVNNTLSFDSVSNTGFTTTTIKSNSVLSYYEGLLYWNGDNVLLMTNNSLFN